MIAFAGLAWTAAKGIFGGLSQGVRTGLLIGVALIAWTAAVWQTSKNAERARNDVAGLKNTIAILQRDGAIARQAVDDADMRESHLERLADSNREKLRALELELDKADAGAKPRSAVCGPDSARASPADVRRLLRFGR